MATVAAIGFWEAGTVEADAREPVVEVSPVADRAPEAIAELHRQHFTALVGLAQLVVDSRAEAEEIVQEAFVRLFVAWPRLRNADKALGYLRSTVLNLARSGLRRRVVARRYLAARGDRDTANAPGADDAGSGLAGGPRAEVLASVRTLPRRQRECVVLRYYGGLDEAAIAETLGISAGSVKTHTHRAMTTLASRLGMLWSGMEERR